MSVVALTAWGQQLSRACVACEMGAAWWATLPLLLLLFHAGDVGSYRPVVVIHGVLTGNTSMDSMVDRIKQMHPGTEVYATDKFNGWTSLAPMWHQVMELGRDLLTISARHPEGVNLIGYSQGGLIARTILQQFPNHNVKTFISLSAPQGGQYGTRFLHLFFPSLVCKTAYELFYSALGQHTSVGNYWKDPHQRRLYHDFSKFLPYVNNEIVTPYSGQYRRGLSKLRRMVLVGGADDGVITPWQSSHFGYFDEEERVVDLRGQPVYRGLDLRALDLQGRLELVRLDGVDHFQWHRNNTVIDDYVLPFLD